MKKIFPSIWGLQFNKYETAPNFIQLSQNFFSLFFPVFACPDHKIVLQIKTKQSYDQVMQKQVKTRNNTEINKQSDVKFWPNQ